jgi:hypothetical protein
MRELVSGGWGGGGAPTLTSALRSHQEVTGGGGGGRRVPIGQQRQGKARKISSQRLYRLKARIGDLEVSMEGVY